MLEREPNPSIFCYPTPFGKTTSFSWLQASEIIKPLKIWLARSSSRLYKFAQQSPIYFSTVINWYRIPCDTSAVYTGIFVFASHTIMLLSTLFFNILAQTAEPEKCGCSELWMNAFWVNSFFTKFSSSLNRLYTSTVFLSIVRLIAYNHTKSQQNHTQSTVRE